MPVVKGVGTGFRRKAACIGGERLSTRGVRGGVVDALCGMRLCLVRSRLGQGRLNLGNISVEGIEKAAPHQTTYYTIALPVTGWLVPTRGYTKHGVRPWFINTSSPPVKQMTGAVRTAPSTTRIFISVGSYRPEDKVCHGYA